MSARALAETEQAADRITADRAHLVAGLAAHGIRVVEPPEGPFVLARVPDGAEVRRRLRDLGYAVRRGDTFPGLGPDWLRIAVRDRETVDGFLAALGSALGSAFGRAAVRAVGDDAGAGRG
jgi:histidinol-phosphate aminotransferase